MAESRELPPVLPLQLPFDQAIAVYFKTFGIFALATLASIGVFSIFILATQAELIPTTSEPLISGEFSWSSSFPGYRQDLYRDGFDTKLSPRWIVLEGEPVIKDSRLSSAAGLLIIQWHEESPNEYTVSMEVSKPETPGDFIAWAAGPDLRYLVTFEDSSAKSVWQTNDGVAWHNASEPEEYLKGGFLELIAANNSYAALADGELRSIFAHSSSQRGPFTLFISQGMYLDSITISVP